MSKNQVFEKTTENARKMGSPRRVYPTYKPSGVVWLGDIPAHWEVRRLKFVSRINPPKTEIASLSKDTEVSFLPMEKIGEDGKLSLVETRAIHQVWQGFTYFRDDDVIVAKITPCFENGKGALCWRLVNGIGFGTTELHVLRAGTGADSKFLLYQTQSIDFRKFGVTAMYGAAGQQRVPEDFVRDFRIGLPPLPEQRAIAAYLDRETARIDALVAKNERLNELLQEKRTALISHAVTRGLDANAPLKDSGVAWLGQVPAHWRLMRLKYATKRMTAGPFGSSLTKDMYSTQGYRIYGQEQVIPGDFSVGDYYIPPELFSEFSRFSVNPGDVLVSLVGTFGKVAIVPENVEPGIINPRLAKIEPAKEIITPSYLGLLLKSRTCLDQMEQISHGGTMGILNLGLLSDLWLSVPPLDEQHAIAAYLDRETAKIDALVGKVRQVIEKLQEYRTALISAAVTGRIQIPGQDVETSS